MRPQGVLIVRRVKQDGFVPKKFSDSSSSPFGHLDDVKDRLRKAVRAQWQDHVERITKPYPLEVPFSVMTTATVDLSTVETGGNSVTAGHADAQSSPRFESVSVMDTWASILGKSAGSVVLDGTFEDIVKVFTTGEIPRRMVIVGEPGSGKSMIAQWLTFQLLAEDAETKLTPVFLSLAAWNPDQPLVEWAAAEMAQTYLFLGDRVEGADDREHTLAYQLIEEKQVLMVLDGLDEMNKASQPEALRRLSAFAAGNWEFVVTCRTEDYARTVYQAQEPLAKTPVIALGPLEMDNVIQYLRDTPLLQGPSAGRWNRFLEDLVTEPDGPLATAMTSSLVVWLVRTNYRGPETDPGDLLALSSAEQITVYLLNGLVDAVYSEEVARKGRRPYPKLQPQDREVQRERLVYFADYLSRQLRKVDGKKEGDKRLDIEWWYMPRVVPKWFVGGTVGVICGCLLGASVGLATTIKFGRTVGLVVGVAFAIVAAIHAGTTSVRWQDEPRAVGFSFSLTLRRIASCVAVAIGVGACFGYAADCGGGLVPALVTAAVVGPLCAMAIYPTFGKWPAGATGVSASLALGLAAGLFGHRPAPAIAAAAAGLTFLVSAFIFTGVFQNASREKAVSPESLLRGDRNGSLIVALTAGLAFAVVFGLALGPLVGLLAFVGLTVTAAFTVSMWGAFTLTRIWLALFRGMPLSIMGFLREAYSRGVLRRAGGAFQFRHVRVQERLAASATEPASGPVPSFRAAAGRGA
jgi:NACHT domain